MGRGLFNFTSLKKPSNLAIRIASASVLVPSFLVILWLGGFAFSALMLLGCLWAGFEWLTLINRPPQKRVWILALFMLAFLWNLAVQWGVAEALLVCLSVSLLAALACWLCRIKKPILISLTVAYLGSAMLALLALRWHGGFHLVAFLCATVWLTDTGAYFAGRSLKGLRMAPGISPSKTWAGFAGGIVAAGCMAGLYALAIKARQPGIAVLYGIAIALATHGGDLFESWVKRQSGVKDSGDVIPGHGGLLDRVDGLMMAAIVFSIILWATDFNFSWWSAF